MALVERSDSELEVSPAETPAIPQKPSFGRRIWTITRGVLVFGMIFGGFFFLQHIKSSFSIIADNPTDESVTFSFDGTEYTLEPYSQISIDITPLKTYRYETNGMVWSVKNRLLSQSHFLNPTGTPYVQVNAIYCLPTMSMRECDEIENQKVNIYTVHKYYVEDYWMLVPEIPTDATICPAGILDSEQISDEEYARIMDAGGCYETDTVSPFQRLEEKYYMQGNWNLDVGKNFPEQVSIAVGGKYGALRKKYKIHSAVWSEEDFYKYFNRGDF